MLNCDCGGGCGGGGKMKCAVKKMVGDEGEAGRLTTISDHCLGIGPTKKKKKNLIYIYIFKKTSSY